MNTYIFTDKYSSATITISANNLEEAEKELTNLLENSKPTHFRVEELND